MSQALAPEPAERPLPKTFFLLPAPSPQVKAADSLTQTLIWLWWYLSHTTRYIQQPAGSLQCFSKGQEPALLNEKELVPCGIVLISAYFEAFYLRLPEYITGINNSHNSHPK